MGEADRMRSLANCVSCGAPTDAMHCTSPTCPWPKHEGCPLRRGDWHVGS